MENERKINLSLTVTVMVGDEMQLTKRWATSMALDLEIHLGENIAEHPSLKMYVITTKEILLCYISS